MVGSSEWDIHSQGMIKLILLRGAQQFARHDGRNLFWVVINTVVSLPMRHFTSLSLTTIMPASSSTCDQPRVP